MSDIQLNAGSGGAYLGTDQVTGTPNIDYQVVKIGYSTTGTAPTQVSTSNPLPITLANTGANATAIKVDGSAVTQPVSGTVTVQQATAANLNATVSGTVAATQSGGWTVTVNGVLADAATFTRGTTSELPVGGVVEALQSGLTTGQSRALSLTTDAPLRVHGSALKQPVSGTYWQAPHPGSRSLTANAGTGTFAISAASLPLPSGAAVDSSVNGILVGQGSTTSGEKGPLVQGAVTTAAPAYTTAQTSPLSLTTAGLLRVDASGTTVPVSGTFWQATQPVSGTVSVTGVLADAATFTRGTTSELPVGGVVEAIQSGLTTGQTRALSLTTTAALRVDGSAVTQPVSGTVTSNQGTAASASGAWPVTLVPQTGNGWSKFSTPKNNSNTPLTATVVSVKSSAAGELGGYIVYNPNSSVAYIQVFDVATAAGVTPGTTRPDMVIPVPQTSGANLEFANGVSFANGIQIAATTTDSGSTAPGTGLTVTIVYK